METKGKNYIIRDLGNVEPERLPFGKLHVLTSIRDFRNANVAYAVMKKPEIAHHHKEATEFYFVTEGLGRIKLNGKEESIHKGQLIIIKPGTIHCAAPIGHPATLEILIVSVPAYTPADELYTIDRKKYGFEESQLQLTLG